MKNQVIKGLAISLLALSVWNCKTSDPVVPSPYESGAYVLNAGNFLDNNGSISFIPRNSATASTDIFNAVNGRTLTGGVQHYNEINGKGIILVDNSAAGLDKIEIVEIGTFKSLGTLKAPDVENPRFVVAAGANKAYISCWGATGTYPNTYINPGYILVVDLASQTVTKKIPVGKGAERIVVVGNEAFVGSTSDDQVLTRALTVINTDTDEVKQPEIPVGVNPSPLAVDGNGRLWAYTPSTKEMIRINPTAKTVETRIKLGADASNANSAGKSPRSFTLSTDKQTFYFVSSFYDATDNYKEKGETYRFAVNSTAETLLIRRVFSGLGVDPTGVLYAGVTPSYKQAGYVLRYQPGTTTATLIDSVKAEIAPSGFFFR